MYKRPDGLYEKALKINGKRVVFRAHSEQEVIHKIADYKGEVEKGRLFSTVADEWQEEHFKTLAYNSTRNYTPAYRRAKDKFGERYIREIKPTEINAFIIGFAKKGNAQKTVQTQLLVLNLIFSKAVVDGDVEYNPVSYVRVPRSLPKKKRELPDAAEIARVKEAVQKPFGLFAYFILYTGCRRGEALALQWKDIDFENKVISITKSVFYEDNRPHIKCPKTASGTREVILLDRLAKKLTPGRAEEYLFPGDNGALMTAKVFENRWKKYRRDAALTVTPHQLRHAYATILFEAGLDVKDAQELLGHASIAMTRDIYTHISKKHREKTAKLLNEFDG